MGTGARAVAQGARKTVVAGLLLRENRLLICQRSPEGEFPNQWEFPGGKIEPGEEPPAALRRELQEELGITAEIGEEVWHVEHQYPGRNPIRLLFFAVAGYSGAVENRVFQQVRWVPPLELAQYDFLEADRSLIGKLASGEILRLNSEKSGK